MGALKNLQASTIKQLIWISIFALFTVSLLFGGYYYWDRYVHLGDQSPLERDIELMEQVIREDPQDAEARVALAEYYLNNGMDEEALVQSDQVLALYPDHQGALLINGITLARLDKSLAAVEALGKFADQRKNQPTANMDTTLQTAYYFLGESYMKLNRPAEAIEVLEAALIINRGDADSLYQLGLAYQANNQAEAALERYHKAVRFVPDFTEAYQGMVVSYQSLNQNDHVQYAQGMEAYTLQDYQTARTHLEKSTQALPNFAPALLGLGLTYEKLGDLDAAKIAIEQAVMFNPDDFAAQQSLGRVQNSLNQ